MHVREVPYIIFKEFAGDGQQYDVHQFARECHPPYPERDIKEDFPNTIRTVGISSEGFGLRLRGHLPDENLPMTFFGAVSFIARSRSWRSSTGKYSSW